MATLTTRLILRKPDPSDLVNVTTDLSENFQKIDDLLTLIAGVNQLPAATSSHIIRGAAAQTADILQVQSSAGGILNKISSIGAQTISLMAAGTSLTITKETSQIYDGSIRLGRTTPASHAATIHWPNGLAIGMSFGQQPNSDNLSVFSWAGAGAASELVRFETSGNVKAIGADHHFGAGALGGTGTYIKIGSAGDTGNAYLIAHGSAADVGLIIRSQGTSPIQFQRSTAAPWGLFDSEGELGSGFTNTSLAVRQDNILKRVHVGAADSGGAGFRLLRVAN